MAENAVVELQPDKPRDHQYWQAEIAASQKLLRPWHKRASKICKRYLGQHITTQQDDHNFSLNLFYSNTKTVQDMLYSTLPKVEASRTNADSADDLARVASEIIQRMLNLDIAANGEEYDSVLRSVLQDRLLPGLGCARVRYEVETQEVEIPAVMDIDGVTVIEPARTQTVVVHEDAPVEYYHWQDILWGWGRSFSKLPWIAFRNYLTKPEVEKRFGAKFKEQVEYKIQKASDTHDTDEFERKDDSSPWQKAEIWEIWDKEKGEVVWYSQGSSKLLDRKPDPLRLKGFFPCPPHLIANLTTTLYRPTPDFMLAQDLYNEIDELQTRVSLITEAVKVVGVYDSNAEGVKRMLKEGCENELIPVDEWAMFAETGGLKSKIDWLPLADVVAALDKLIQIRDNTITLLQMVTGMADIMQGAVNPYEGVGQSQIKAQYGSVRIQALQDQFARFAGDLMQLKAEVICKHFEPQTIVQQSNMQFSMDAELVPQAVELLKQPEMANVRIVVRPETVAMVDYARLKSERADFLNAMATFMQSAAPMLETEPDAMPYLLKMLQWSMAGFKGSQEIEGVLDKAIEGAIQKAQQPQQPDPEAAKEQAKLQGEMQKIQAKGQADLALREADKQADIQTAMAASQAKMAEISATHQARITEIITKLKSDLQREQYKLQGDLQQIDATVEAEVGKVEATTGLELYKEAEKAIIALEEEGTKSELKINEIAEASASKITEMLMNTQESGEDRETE
jgi:hypothetical protein